MLPGCEVFVDDLAAMHLGQDRQDLERQSEEGVQIEPSCGEQHG